MKTLKTLTFFNTLLSLLLMLASFVYQLGTITEMHTGGDPGFILGYCFGSAAVDGLKVWVGIELVCLVVVALVSVIRASERSEQKAK